GSPVSPAERVDVVRLLDAYTREGSLSRPIHLEVSAPVFARVGLEDLESSVGRILAFLCQATPLPEGQPPAPVKIRAGYDAGRPFIQLEDPLFELSEERRAAIFDPHIQADSRSGHTMRLNFGLALAWRLLRRMGADL